ncbi:MAG: DUF2442 domain-containing protein [Deferrisomatales bacterium]
MTPRSDRTTPQGFGAGDSPAFVARIASHAVWLLAGGEELFFPFGHFPWFRRAAVSAVLRIEEPRPGHFHWPDLDVDLTRDTILHPERYPLVSRQGAGTVREAEGR